MLIVADSLALSRREGRGKVQNSLDSVNPHFRHVERYEVGVALSNRPLFFPWDHSVVALTAAMTLMGTGTGIRGLRVDVGLVPMMTKS